MNENLKFSSSDFRNGSIVTDTQIVFSSNGSIPDVNNVTQTLIDAANNSTLLNITTSSINVSSVG